MTLGLRYAADTGDPRMSCPRLLLLALLLGAPGCFLFNPTVVDPIVCEDLGDADGDGVCDPFDLCDGDDAADEDEDGVPDACDACAAGNDAADIDGDGIADACDACTVGEDAEDEDGDGIADACDPCPKSGNLDGLTEAEKYGDSDDDGVCDDVDACPGHNDHWDRDGDGVANGCDPCPDDNPDDSDLDGSCDADDTCPGFDDTRDGDGDGVPNGCEQCGGFDDTIDGDGDGVPDGCDLCEGFNDTKDRDGDGTPNGCDLCPDDPDDDSDGDGVCDGVDACEGGDDALDGDGDGVADFCDPCPLDDPDDSDLDGVCDVDDICPGAFDSVDNDDDGVPDECDDCPNDGTKLEPGVCGCGVPDTDEDEDGELDCLDICPGFSDVEDADLDGVPDGCDICGLGDDTIDVDFDDVPDACDICMPGDDTVDTDEDTVPDDCDICEGGDDAIDGDDDGQPDFCDPCPVDPLDDSDHDGSCDGVDICPDLDDFLDSDEDTVPDCLDECWNADDFLDDNSDGWADTCWEREPNEDPFEASGPYIAIGEHFGEMEGLAQDWFLFVFDQPGWWEVEIRDDLGGCSFDSILEIWDEDDLSEMRWSDNNGGIALCSLAYVYLDSPGTFFLMVAGEDAGEDGIYFAQATRIDPTKVEAEPNDLADEPTGPMEGNTTWYGGLDVGDVDRFELVVTEEAVIVELLTTDTRGGCRVDTIVSVGPDEGDPHTPWLWDHDVNLAGCSELRAMLTTGTWIVTVEGETGTEEGFYALQVRQTPIEAYELEDNGTMGAASFVPTGLDYHANLLAGDEDFYALVITEDGTLVNIDTTDNRGKCIADTYLELGFDDGGTFTSMYENNGAGYGECARLEVKLDTGTWYIKVRGDGGSDDGYYIYRADALGPDIGEEEPNDSLASADGPLTEASQWWGFMDQDGSDEDWYFFDVDVDSALVTLLVSNAAGDCSLDTWMKVGYDNGNGGFVVLAEDDEAGPGLCSKIDVILDQGTYLVQLTADPSLVDDNPYTLTILFGDPENVEVEPNDDTSMASGPITDDVDVSGWVNPQEVDFWELIITENDTYVVMETTDPLGGCPFDTRLAFGTQSGVDGFTVIRDNDDAGYLSCSKVTINLNVGTYFIRIGGDQIDDFGLYTLRLRFQPPFVIAEEPNHDLDHANGPITEDVRYGADLTLLDVDYYQLVIATNGQEVRIETQDEDGECPFDTEVDLGIPDSAGRFFLQYDDEDGGLGQCDLLDLTLDAGTYYIRVQGKTQLEEGPYELIVDFRE